MRRLVCLLLLTVSLGLSGCGSLLSPVKTPEVKTFALTAFSTKTYRKRAGHKTILVSTPRSVEAYDSNEMLYTETPYQLRAFTQHAWVSTPADMLQPLVVQSLRHTRAFHAVVAAPFNGENQYRLDLKVLELQQDFIQQPSVEHLVVQVDLVKDKTDKVIASKRFQESVICEYNTPYAGVVAANQATKQMMQQLAKFVIDGIRSN